MHIGSKTYGNMAASHSRAVQRGVCFCLRVGLKLGPEGVRGRQIRSFLSAHKRMRIYTRKCLSLCQIGFSECTARGRACSKAMQ